MKKSKKYLVGLQLYSVRSDLAADFEGTLKRVSEMGYDGVEFAGLYGKTAQEVKALCEKYDLVPVSAHIPLSEMTADPYKVFELYSEIGCRYAAVPYIGVEERPLHKNYDATVKSIAKVAEIAKNAGIQLMYHNHDFEFVKLENGQYGLDDLYSRIPAELLTAELDLCWVNVGGEDPCQYLKKYSDRIPVVHFKDFVMPGKKSEKLYKLIGLDDNEASSESSEDAFSFRPVGYGAQNVPAMLEALDGSVCEWIIVEQDEPSMSKTRMECAEMSINYLNGIM